MNPGSSFEGVFCRERLASATFHRSAAPVLGMPPAPKEMGETSLRILDRDVMRRSGSETGGSGILLYAMRSLDTAHARTISGPKLGSPTTDSSKIFVVKSLQSDLEEFGQNTICGNWEDFSGGRFQ